MSFITVPHTPGPYGLLLDIQEPLLACLSLLLLAVACYLLVPGVARCVQLVRASTGAARSSPAWNAAVPARLRAARPSAPLSLLSAPDQPRAPLSRLARQIKLRARSLLAPRQTRQWLDFWNLTDTHAALAVATPRLLHKIYRPYQSLRLRRPQRLEILTSHYDFVIRRGLAPLVLQASQQQIPIGQFQGKSGQDYEVRLAAINSLDHEGELALHLYRGQDHLFSTAFTLCRQGSGWIVRIGCLQGSGGADSREQIRRATRDLFGLRPKALMIRMVRAIGAGHGCSRVLLVSNGNRVAGRRGKGGRVHADYDAFWQELGAARRSDGDYELPCEETAPALQSLPSRKRAEARQRLALTQAVTQQVRGALVRTGT
ncbi:VirK/YbjX family protein [Herbaspirillum huttiense]|uniref:VirK/YbjX family protein n=2 Tax=Herbaspirillum huttiense TaxID=863372 RepID=A0AAJ2H6S5_9BURK|nr:VirK/YbjX family protein [Herbaspirillum huttiense]MDR9835409.1 VirK/YbjX family protein [Herbaspirillum huttiense]